MLASGDMPDFQVMVGIAGQFVENVATPCDDSEKEYLLNAAKGIFMPELLFNDYPGTFTAAINDPAAQWKMQNLRRLNS